MRDSLAGLLGNGHIADAILLITAMEGVAFAVFHRWTGRGIPLAEILGNLLAGAFLVLALRCALSGAPWPWLGLCLLLALAAHLADLRVRLGHRGRVRPGRETPVG